ncbi:E3 ubiquitin-protein ligase RKP [Striga hermonthica]|uniref:RING-type E3 ubiquitin transferase n=1 Tax=Striga hermonthica TaxID=68872 RepID=A0A9N7NUB7_STRHE|nr:E3 ubiquitin-protein ligase RKP [Striga hermonthica]
MDDILRIGGHSSGLAVVLNGEDRKEGAGKSRLVSYCEGFGDQSVERTLEHIFNLPYKKVHQLTGPIDNGVVRSILKNDFYKHHPELKAAVSTNRDGVSTISNDPQLRVVGLEESSICGDIRIVKKPFLVESHALFSSVRANTCVWKGKWMYEVTLETSGIQQLGWATIACPFTDHKGVGDADDSYAYDGKRVSKWSKDANPYGQSWVVGDVIGCCIDLDRDEVLFYRNGISLGVAFAGIRKMVPGLGYYPAISLSQGERCELNFGGHPFKYPIKGYHPIQAPPSSLSLAASLLDCFLRLLQMQRTERAEIDTVEKLRRLKRFASFEELLRPVSHGICEELLSVISAEFGSAEYLGHGTFLSFMMDIFRVHPPHDYQTLDRVLDSFLGFEESKLLLKHVFGALSSRCKTASLVLTECPYSGSYSYLALACHILRRQELMTLWWESSDFEFLFEGFLSRKSPNKQDLQCLIPSVWWPGSCEDISSENSMVLTTTALSEAVNKIEEKQRDICRLVMKFIPPVAPMQLPGSVFRTFLQNILLKNRGADRNMPPTGVSNNSVLVSLFTVILHFLSEGFAVGDIHGWIKGSGTTDSEDHVGFLHRGGEQCFPAGLFLKGDPHRVDISRLGGSYSHLLKSNPVNDEEEEEIIRWEEGCTDDEETKATHIGSQKPCCCSSYDNDLSRMSKYPVRYLGKGSHGSCSSISDRASHVSAECSTSSLNDEIADKPSTSDHSDPEFSFRPMQQLRILPRESVLPSPTLKEEELLDAMLLLYHLGLAPNLKQASSFMSRQSQSVTLLEDTDRQIRECIYVDQVKRLKEARSVYREEVMDCVRHSHWYWSIHFLFYDFISKFLFSGMCVCVISSAELRDLLLHSILVLVQDTEFLAAFECNKAARERMPKALLSAFDNRSWIPVTNILLRLCKGSGFGFSKRGESSSSSVLFQRLLREACISDDELFSAFLNRLFNTLSWAMTEFSVSVREMQENKLKELQQRKCSVIFDLSCNLARVLEFCTRETPQAFVLGMDTNLRRLAELIVFILTHLIVAIDPEDLSIRRSGHSSEKINSGMILAPLAGIILNLLDASRDSDNGAQNDIVSLFASMECADTIRCGFEYLLNYNWAGSTKGEDYKDELSKLNTFSSRMISRSELQANKKRTHGGDSETEDNSLCCICYENKAEARFSPCSHVSKPARIRLSWGPDAAAVSSRVRRQSPRLPIRRHFASITVQSAEDVPAVSSQFASTIAPSSLRLSHRTITRRHIQVLSFFACAVAISATWLFCSAIPTLLAFKRAAESLEKLMDTTREELPDTMAAVRLSGMEISDLTMELSDLGQEITQGVRSSTRAVRLAEERLRRLTNTNPIVPAQDVGPTKPRTADPTLARTARNMREGIVKGRAVIQTIFTLTRYSKILLKYLASGSKA